MTYEQHTKTYKGKLARPTQMTTTEAWHMLGESVGRLYHEYQTALHITALSGDVDSNLHGQTITKERYE